MSEAEQSMYAALARAQAKIGRAIKDKVNPHLRAKYADLAAVQDACMEQLTAEGICVVQSPSTALTDGQLWVCVETRLHYKGESMQSTLALPAPKSDPQIIGALITYARKYALAAMAGVAQDDDDAASVTVRTPEMDHGQRERLKELESAAAKGKAHLERALQEIPQDERMPFRPHIDRLKAIAKAADGVEVARGTA